MLAVGLGVVPFLLGAGWAYSRLRDADRRRRAFAALAGLSLPLLALETASYDVRFGGPDVCATATSSTWRRSSCWRPRSA